MVRIWRCVNLVPCKFAFYHLCHVIKSGCCHWSSVRAASSPCGIRRQFACAESVRCIQSCIVRVLSTKPQVRYFENSSVIVTTFGTLISRFSVLKLRLFCNLPVPQTALTVAVILQRAEVRYMLCVPFHNMLLFSLYFCHKESFTQLCCLESVS